MLATIARKERLELWRDGRFRAVAVAIGLLLLTAVALGTVRQRDLAREHVAAQALTREHWEAQGPKNPHSAAHYGIYAFKPRTALSVLDEGVDPYVGVAAWLEAHKQNEFQFRPAQDATAAQRFGSLTAAVVLQVLMPLAIILLAFGAFAGEREQGTLRQVLALGVAPRTLVGGKVLGVATALGALAVPAAAVGAAAVFLTAGMQPADDLPRFVALAGGYLLYFAAWAGASLAVSAWAPSSRTALMGLLGTWMVMTVLIPRSSTDLVRRWYPTPSQAEFRRAVARDLELGLDGHSPAGDRRAAFEREVLARYGVERIDQLPVNFAGLALQQGEEEGNQVFDRHFGALWAQYGRQERAREWLGLVAPVLAVRSLSMGLAGTDVAHHERFTEAAEAYRRLLVQAMNDDMARHAGSADFQYVARPTLFAEVPAFEYAAPSLGWVLGEHWPGLLVLGVWTVGGGLLATAAAARLRP